MSGNGADDLRLERIATTARDLAEEVRGRLHVVEQKQIAEQTHSVALLADVRAIREELRSVTGVAVAGLSQRMLGVEFALENQGRLLLEILELVRGDS